MKTTKLTLEQVYDMFGCNEKPLNLEEIFNILLCSIAEIGYYDASTITSYTDDAIYQKCVYFYPKMSEVKNRLPKYLDVEVSMLKAKKLDDLMFTMKKETEAYHAVPWYQIVSKIKAMRTYKKTANKTVRIEKVFRLLEYRAVYRCNMSVADLRKRFYAYADEFSNKLY